MMKRILTVLMIAGLASLGLAAGESKQAKADDKREKIDSVARETLNELFRESSHAKELYGKAYGYAVFTNLKFALGVSGGGGSGVAVVKKSDDRTYMKMGTAGVGLGLGGRKYQVVFLFETKTAFDSFVEKGWQADTSASATAGTAGAEVASSFRNGMAVYQFSDKGLMAHAEIAGAKFWKADKLN